MTTLRTARLVLRRAQATDLDALFEIFSDDETMRFWSSPAHRSIETTRAWLEAMMESCADVSEDFVIEQNGLVIGKVGCFRLPDIGFVLRRDRWGQGLMFEAASALVEHLVQTRAVETIRADVDPQNARSLRLLKRLEFRETGRAERTYCIDGVWMDSVYLARSARPQRMGT